MIAGVDISKLEKIVLKNKMLFSLFTINNNNINIINTGNGKVSLERNVVHDRLVKKVLKELPNK